jgi:hypothetical protein
VVGAAGVHQVEVTVVFSPILSAKGTPGGNLIGSMLREAGSEPPSDGFRKLVVGAGAIESRTYRVACS